MTPPPWPAQPARHRNTRLRTAPRNHHIERTIHPGLISWTIRQRSRAQEHGEPLVQIAESRHAGYGWVLRPAVAPHRAAPAEPHPAAGRSAFPPGHEAHQTRRCSPAYSAVPRPATKPRHARPRREAPQRSVDLLPRRRPPPTAADHRQPPPSPPADQHCAPDEHHRHPLDHHTAAAESVDCATATPGSCLVWRTNLPTPTPPPYPAPTPAAPHLTRPRTTPPHQRRPRPARHRPQPRRARPI